jgi:hypothetical protein
VKFSRAGRRHLYADKRDKKSGNLPIKRYKIRNWEQKADIHIRRRET